MYCRHCGAEIPEPAAFCPACGGRLAETAGEKKARRPSPRMKRLLAILGGVAAVILVLVIALSAVNRHRRTEDLGGIPDPEAFFGLSAEHNDWGRDGYRHEITFESDRITRERVQAYVDLLKEEPYPFVLDETIPFADGMVRYVFCYSGEKELYDAEEWQILVEYDPGRKTGYAQIVIRNSENFRLVPPQADAPGDPSPQPTATPSPTPAPTPSPTPLPEDPSVLPDFLVLDTSKSFTQGRANAKNVVAFLSDADDVGDVTEAYVQNLLRMGYRISDTEEKSNQYMRVYRWYLTHADVSGTTVQDTAQVCVKHMLHIPYKSGEPYTEVSITYGSGVTYAGETMTGSGGGSGSSGGSSSTRTPCSICNRTGDCQTCGGDGYLWSSAADKKNRNCYSCRNHNGKCTYCNGTGWRD